MINEKDIGRVARKQTSGTFLKAETSLHQLLRTIARKQETLLVTSGYRNLVFKLRIKKRKEVEVRKQTSGVFLKAGNFFTSVASDHSKAKATKKA